MQFSGWHSIRSTSGGCNLGIFKVSRGQARRKGGSFVAVREQSGITRTDGYCEDPLRAKTEGGGGERREAVACAERYVLRSPARLPFVVGEIYFELKTSISADM